MLLNNPVVQMMLTGIFWSLGGVLIKLVDWNPFAIACVRSLVAMSFLCAVNKRLPRFSLKKNVEYCKYILQDNASFCFCNKAYYCG